LNVEQKLKKILEVWKDVVISSKDYLRPLPKDNEWNTEILVTGKIVCPFEV